VSSVIFMFYMFFFGFVWLSRCFESNVDVIKKSGVTHGDRGSGTSVGKKNRRFNLFFTGKQEGHFGSIRFDRTVSFFYAKFDFRQWTQVAKLRMEYGRATSLAHNLILEKQYPAFLVGTYL
jgi:hypothetical protein